MFGDIEYALRENLRDQEYAEEYAVSFLNAYIATQIKVVREQRGMTQAALGREIGTTQTGISRIENVNYSSWSIRTLIKLARAFHVRLKVSFEPFGTLPNEVVQLDRESLERVPREDDPSLKEKIASSVGAVLHPHRDGNVLFIDSMKAISATDKKNVREITQSELAEETSNQIRVEGALCR
jgi:transcriptional regulator with XRE-family HTH domain